MDIVMLAFMCGFCVGGAVLNAMYKRNVIVAKAKDGTAEYIGNDHYYIITGKQWCLLEAWRLPMLERAERERLLRELECGSLDTEQTDPRGGPADV